MDYDFRQLSDKEFEILVADILSVRENRKFERFRPGRDGGVDARVYCTEGKEIILQGKHYVGSGTTRLIYDLEKKELAKVKRLSPIRYIIATSCPLSLANKTKIQKIFSPFISTPSDILGSEDLNDELRNDSKIELRHNKLWIGSTSILKKLILPEAYNNSEALIQRVEKRCPVFVETSNFQSAQEKLDTEKVLILTGEPGVGKTTLAEHLSIFYLSNDYSVFDISDATECQKIFSKEEKQLFLYDDFLGSNYLEAITDQKDAKIVKFFEQIKNGKNKRFILTSRTNILNQGLIRSDTLASANPRKNEYLLDVTELSALEKAEVLYNHIWHSNLESRHVEELYKNERYVEIIKHRNYNPRLIHFITNPSNDDFPASEKYWNYILNNTGIPQEG